MWAIGHISVYFSFVRLFANGYSLLANKILTSLDINNPINAKAQNISVIYSFLKQQKIERKKQFKLHEHNMSEEIQIFEISFFVSTIGPPDCI